LIADVIANKEQYYLLDVIPKIDRSWDASTLEGIRIYLRWGYSASNKKVLPDVYKRIINNINSEVLKRAKTEEWFCDVVPPIAFFVNPKFVGGLREVPIGGAHVEVGEDVQQK